MAADFVPTSTNLGRIVEENGRRFLIKEGPTQPNGYSSTIGNLDWRGISELVSKNIVNKDPKYILRNLSPIVNGKFATEFTNAWSVLTLFPKLGVRATIDELFFFVNYAPKEALYNFFSLKGLAGAKIRGAATAKNVENVGIFSGKKSIKRTATGISLSAEKLQKIPNLLGETETVAIFNKFFEDVSLTKNEQMFAARREIAELAVERFTGISTRTLTPDQKKDFVTFLTYNPSGSTQLGYPYPNADSGSLQTPSFIKHFRNAENLWYRVSGSAQCNSVMRMASTASVQPHLTNCSIAHSVTYTNPNVLDISTTASPNTLKLSTPLTGSWSPIKGYTLMTGSLNTQAPPDWLFDTANWWNVTTPTTDLSTAYGRSGNALGNGGWTNRLNNTVYGLANVATGSNGITSNFNTLAVYIK